MSTGSPTNTTNTVNTASISIGIFPLSQVNSLLGIQGWEPLYSSNPDDIVTMDSGTFRTVRNKYSSEILSDEGRDTQVITLDPVIKILKIIHYQFSETLWEPTPPTESELVNVLEDPSKIVTLQVRMTFTRSLEVKFYLL